DDDDHHLIDGTKTYKNVGEYFVGGLEGIMTRYEDYIERSLLPNAYRKALVENYLTTENYGTLGRSYARKIQYVALPNFEGYEDSTKNLVRTYCRLVLEKTDAQLVSDIRAAIPSLTEDKAKEYAAKAKDLHFLDLLYAGYFPEATDKALADMIYSAAGFTAFAGVDSDGDGTIETLPTYAETTYGKLADDWSKLTDSRWETGSVTDFTSGGTYSKNTGLTMKTRDIVASSKVTEGWYTSSGLSDLPSSMKGRLFKMNVANEVDYDDLGKDQLKFTWRLADGSYYLTPETYQTSNTEPYAMFDDSSKTWYIIRIDEAVKVAKLADPEDSDISYGKKEIAEKREAQGKESLNEIVWDVADLIADGDAYRSSARQYFVSKMALAFHDDAIYEYFEATFPDLFD
ncbi:MAG: hypothetical protein HUJ60_01085, partial [Bacilli bacterium]|nr:hypothetical protein [Bacilli bacterium]